MSCPARAVLCGVAAGSWVRQLSDKIRTHWRSVEVDTLHFSMLRLAYFTFLIIFCASCTCWTEGKLPNNRHYQYVWYILYRWRRVPVETPSLEGTWIVQVWVCVSLALTLYGSQVHARIGLTPREERPQYQSNSRPRGLQNRTR